MKGCQFMFQETKPKRSPVQIVGIVVIFILAVLIILTFVIFGIFRKEGAAPKLFGYRVYVVTNARMEPKIPEGSAVFVEEGTLPDPSAKSVILCNIEDELYVIRFIGTETDETGDVRYLVKYDNATDDRTWGISQSDIVGVARTYDTFLGGVIRFASSKAGMMTIVIIPCLLIIAYEVGMLLLSRRRADGSDRWRGESSQTRKTKVKPVTPREERSEPIFRVGGGPDPEDISPERENIQAPVDVAKEERYVEKQLRKANDKLNNTVLESTGVIEAPEISLDPIRLDADTSPKPDVSQAIESLREAVSEVKAAEAKPAEPKPEEKKPVDSSVGELSASRIDELIKLLEEEKKRLSDQ